jgi:hypothetical protein
VPWKLSQPFTWHFWPFTKVWCLFYMLQFFLNYFNFLGKKPNNWLLYISSSGLSLSLLYDWGEREFVPMKLSQSNNAHSLQHPKGESSNSHNSQLEWWSEGGKWLLLRCCSLMCCYLDLWVEDLAAHGGRCARSMFFHLFLYNPGIDLKTLSAEFARARWTV